eukprot:COSAG01_NODE_27714_length_678_cov_64.894646_1_plen_86_part_10
MKVANGNEAVRNISSSTPHLVHQRRHVRYIQPYQPTCIQYQAMFFAESDNKMQITVVSPRPYALVWVGLVSWAADEEGARASWAAD